MTPNKLPPLPELVDAVAKSMVLARNAAEVNGRLAWDDLVSEAEHYADREAELKNWRMLAGAAIEAIRQSQSLPAGAVAGLAAQLRQMASWCKSSEDDDGTGTFIPAYASGDVFDILTQAALQADAREKGEAVFRLYPEELARMTHGPSLRAEEEDRLRSIYGDVAIPLYLHSGDYTEAMLLLEKQRELVENLRGQLDDAKADATDGCTEANCERCNTAIHSRGDMRHAGIGTYPATQPAQASEAAGSVSVKQIPRRKAYPKPDENGNETGPIEQHAYIEGWNDCVAAIRLATSSQETASE